MEEIFNKIRKNPVEPIRLSEDNRFKFKCYKGISCFNKCCGSLDIFLTPYDIVRIKNRLGMSSSEFILKHTEKVMLKKTHLPLVKIKMNDKGICRFVTDAGCTIYSDRPLACRYYPIGLGMLKSKEIEGGEFYFFVKEDHCNGFKENKEWSVKEWRIDQGANIYDDMNKDWFDIILNKKLYGSRIEPDDKSLNLFFMGSYDIDSFRDFVFESRFLQVFDLSEEMIEIIKNDEAELMKFAHRWMQYALFKEPTIKLKKDVAHKKQP